MPVPWVRGGACHSKNAIMTISCGRKCIEIVLCCLILLNVGSCINSLYCIHTFTQKYVWAYTCFGVIRPNIGYSRMVWTCDNCIDILYCGLQSSMRDYRLQLQSKLRKNKTGYCRGAAAQHFKQKVKGSCMEMFWEKRDFWTTWIMSGFMAVMIVDSQYCPTLCRPICQGSVILYNTRKNSGQLCWPIFLKSATILHVDTSLIESPLKPHLWGGSPKMDKGALHFASWDLGAMVYRAM